MIDENKKTIGQRFVERFPSQHPDRFKASEQMRGLSNFIDLLVPQSVGEFVLGVTPLGVVGKGAAKGARASFKGARELYSKFKKRRFDEDVFGEETTGITGRLTRIAEKDEALNFVNNWFKKDRGPVIEQVKAQMDLQDLNDVRYLNKPIPKSETGGTIFGHHIPSAIEASGVKLPSVKQVVTTMLEQGMIKSASDVYDNPAILKVVKKNVKEHKDVLYKKYGRPRVEINSDVYGDYEAVKSLSDSQMLTPFMSKVTTIVHEFTHAITKGNKGLGKLATDYINKMKTESFEILGSQVSVGASRFSFLHDKMRETTVKMHKYLSSETEIFSRIMEMRYVLGETVENLNANYVRLPRGIEMARRSRAYNELRRVLGHEQIEKLYNNLPAMLPVGTLAGLQTQLDSEIEVLESVDKIGK
tara:strand:- start:361 stop:1608 length:1248 start_codon:yes stop_codon:yes gene_type:complete